MFEQKAISIGGMPYDKSAIIYFDQKITPKACILYFHGGGLLYGHKDDLPEGHLRLLTQAGYRKLTALTAFPIFSGDALPGPICV